MEELSQNGNPWTLGPQGDQESGVEVCVEKRSEGLGSQKDHGNQKVEGYRLEHEGIV